MATAIVWFAVRIHDASTGAADSHFSERWMGRRFPERHVVKTKREVRFVVRWQPKALHEIVFQQAFLEGDNDGRPQALRLTSFTNRSQRINDVLHCFQLNGLPQVLRWDLLFEDLERIMGALNTFEVALTVFKDSLQPQRLQLNVALDGERALAFYANVQRLRISQDDRR